ncbi:hypothetical protein K9L97_01540 [Candidatus Woesearchaeota archaeon]|nr:hypothetical protein [Candidatus Woesearchaeota archaeon]
MKLHQTTKITKFLGVVTLMFILILQTTSAATNFDVNLYKISYDFMAGAITPTPTICSCATQYDKIYIENTGSFGADYKVTSNLQNVASPPGQIHLEPGEKIYVDLFLQANCQEEHTKNYEVYITNNYGNTKTITRNLQTIRCQTIDAQLYTAKEKIDPCQSTTYTIYLTNPSPFQEQYLLKFQNQTYELTLNSNQTGTQNFTYQASCEDYGNKTNQFIIESINNQLISLLEHQIEINRAYNYDVQIHQEAYYCVNEKTRIPIDIKNNGKVDNEYTINLQNTPSFIKTTENTISIEKGKEKQTYLEIQPTAEGEHTITINTESKKGDLKTSQNTTIKTLNCFDMQVEIQGPKPQELCTGKHEIPIKIHNNGLNDEKIKLWLYDPTEITQLEDQELEISAGETEQTKLLIEKYERTEEFTIYVSATIHEKDVNQIFKDSQKIIIKDNYQCTQLEFPEKSLKVRYEENYATIPIKNIGILETNYNIKYEGPKFIELQTEEIEIKSQETEYIQIKLYANQETEAPQETQYFTLKITSDETKQEYTQQFKLKMVSEPIQETLYKYFTQTTCKKITAILLILIIIATIMLIIRYSIKKSKHNTTFILITTIIIILIIIINVLVNNIPKYDLPELDQEKVNDKFYLIWYEDTKYELDLTKYFQDPDNDTLSYELEKPLENIQITFKDNKATLKPTKDWYGKDEIKIIAKDPAEEEIKSPRIRLEVIDTAEIKPLDFYEQNCSFINNALIIILLIIILFTPYFKKKQQKQPEPIIQKKPTTKKKNSKRK